MNTDLTLSYDQTRELIDDLWQWNQNFNFPSPASLFLDLIGWSMDELGEPLCPPGGPALGYQEQHLIGWALLAYAHRPGDVLERVAELMAEGAE